MCTTLVRKGTAFTMALLVVTATSWVLPDATTEARQVRNTTRANVNRNVNQNRNANFNRNANVSRNVNRSQNINRNVNVNRNYNVNRDIDVDVDHHYGGYYGGYHPVATAAAVTAAATVTAAAIGSIVYSLPRSCSAVVVNGFTYQNCSGTWYQPQYAGSQVTYVVVNPPQ
jgi:hypothetical protein